MRTVFFAFTLFFAGIAPALGSPLDFSYTHNTTLTVPELSEPEASFHLAKTWFLPDWQAGMGSRTDTAPAGSGDTTATACETTYNLFSSCTAPQTVKKTHNLGKLICYECECPTSYKYTSCNTGYVLAGGSCNGKFLRCDATPCPSGYTAGKTCGSGYDREVNGKSGSQDCAKCVAKSCPSGYTAGLANCNGKTYPAGWTYSSNGYSGDSVCGKCTAKTCSSGTAGLTNCNGKAQPSGWTYSSNGYAGDSVCGTCTAKSCPAGYTAGTTGCSNTTSWTYGSNGYAGDRICGKCTSKDCADGYTAGLANCNGKAHPVGWTYSTGTPSGSTVCGKCTAKACSAGSTSCDTATQNATANGYYAGDSTCYTCSAKTCEQLGKKTCNGSCIATSECCGGCGANQKCENGTCVQDKTPMELCTDQIAAQDSTIVFVKDFTEFKKVSSNAKIVVLTDNVDGSSYTFNPYNAASSYSRHTRTYYNPLTYGLSKNIPECTALKICPEDAPEVYPGVSSCQEPFNFSLTLGTGTITDKDISFYVPITLDALTIKSSDTTVSNKTHAGAYFYNTANVSEINTSGRNLSVSFGDTTYVGSYNNKAVLSSLSFRKEFYGNPAEIKKLPAYFESISNSGGTLSIHAEFADITLLSSSISSSSMYSNHMNITLSYSTLQFDAGYGTSFDLGYSVDEYWSILLTQGCLVNTNRNAYKPYLCGNGQYRFYACDRDQCNLHNTNTCSGFNGDYVINGSSSKSCYRFEGSASYYDSYPYSY